jgi:hypothetical protein
MLEQEVIPRPDFTGLGDGLPFLPTAVHYDSKHTFHNHALQAPSPKPLHPSDDGALLA